MLEEKVKELIVTMVLVKREAEIAATLKKDFDDELKALPGAEDIVNKYLNKAREMDASQTAHNNRRLELQKEILGLMTEKSHKFDCATITKKVTRSLEVDSPRQLLADLPPGVYNKVKFTFPKADIIKLVDLDALSLNTNAKITEKESLAVKIN